MGLFKGTSVFARVRRFAYDFKSSPIIGILAINAILPVLVFVFTMHALQSPDGVEIAILQNALSLLSRQIQAFHEGKLTSIIARPLTISPHKVRKHGPAGLIELRRTAPSIRYARRGPDRDKQADKEKSLRGGRRFSVGKHLVSFLIR